MSVRVDPPEVPQGFPNRRRLTAINGAMALVAVLLIVQIWLLTTALETFLAGDHEAALPAAVASGVLFAASLGLYLLIERISGEDRGSSS